MSADPFTPTSELSIVNETALTEGNHDFIFTSEQLKEFDTHLLRNLAAHANTDEVNGKSTALEMQAYFRCQRSLSEFADD